MYGEEVENDRTASSMGMDVVRWLHLWIAMKVDVNV